MSLFLTLFSNLVCVSFAPFIPRETFIWKSTHIYVLNEELIFFYLITVVLSAIFEAAPNSLVGLINF